jgi:integrase
MATIVRRNGPHGRRYQVRIRLHDQAVSATFRTLTAARRWARTTEGTLLERRALALPDPSRYTLGDLLTRYIGEVLPQKPPGTARKYAQHLAWWQAQLGSLRLHALRPAHLAAQRDQLATAHAPATVNAYLASLAHAFSVAVQEWGWLEASVVTRIKRLRAPHGRVRCLADDERQRLLAACAASHQPLLYPVVLLALSTGARKQELLTLRWADVDLRRGQLLLQDTKNGERRAVPLTGKAFEVMQTLGRVRRIDTALCFPRTDGTAPADIRYAWKLGLQEAGIQDFRFHDLRHTFASYLAMNGASLIELAEILGHKTLAMVKRYAHLTEAHATEVVRRMTAEKFG